MSIFTEFARQMLAAMRGSTAAAKGPDAELEEEATEENGENHLVSAAKEA
jgi:hypothetical protein